MRILCESRTESGLETLDVYYREPEDLAACVANCLDWIELAKTKRLEPVVWGRVTVDNEEAE